MDVTLIMSQEELNTLVRRYGISYAITNCKIVKLQI